MYGFISDQYGQRWGPFCAGVVLAAIPVVRALLLPAAVHHRGPHRGRGQGIAKSALASDRAAPRRLGAYVPETPSRSATTSRCCSACPKRPPRSTWRRAVRARRRAAGRPCRDRRETRRTSGGARRCRSGTRRSPIAGSSAAATSATRGSTGRAVQPRRPRRRTTSCSPGGPAGPTGTSRRRLPGLPRPLRDTSAFAP